MHIRNPFSNMDTAANYSIFSPNKTQNPELDDKSSKENVNIYILIIFIDIILVRITMKKIIFTKTKELTNIFINILFINKNKC